MEAHFTHHQHGVTTSSASPDNLFCTTTDVGRTDESSLLSPYSISNNILKSQLFNSKHSNNVVDVNNSHIMPTDSISSFLIGNVLEALSLQEDSTSKNGQVNHCSCEDDVLADSFCQNCKEYLCQRCVLAHYRVRLTKDHSIVKVGI